MSLEFYPEVYEDYINTSHTQYIIMREDQVEYVLNDIRCNMICSYNKYAVSWGKVGEYSRKNVMYFQMQNEARDFLFKKMKELKLKALLL